MKVVSWLNELDPLMQTCVGLAALLLLAYVVQAVVQYVLLHAVPKLRQQMAAGWAQILLHNQVLRRLAHVAPSVIIQLGIAFVPHLHAGTTTVIRNVAAAVTVLQVVRTLLALLDAMLERNIEESGKAETSVRSIKSYVQLGKLVLSMVCAIVIVGVLLDRSPLILLSGLGAMSAVLMLVFKDTILSFTAGVQLSSNDMLRVGDWIEMPQVGADGFVVDIALHTVKVQNWDKTITSIPTWRLMSDSFKNWRGMFNSGGRRIRRALRIDTTSIRLLQSPEVAHLQHIALLQPYWAQQQASASATPQSSSDPTCQHRSSNISAYRAYVDAYVRSHPSIHKDMLMIVRTMEATAEGLPLEVFCYTNTTAWVEYEEIQGALFDHMIAVLPEFGLRLYQSPSGNDLRGLLQSGG